MNQDALPTIDDLVAHRPWVRRLAGALAHDSHAADDLTQDAYATALAHPPGRPGWRTWMRRVVTNRARNVHRETTRRDARERRRGVADAARPTLEVVAEADAHRHVVDAVMDLDEPLRSTVLLRWFEELSVADVAARTGAPLETTRSRLARAKELLRERLDREHGSRAAWCAPLLGPGWDAPGGGGARAASRARVAGAAALAGGLVVKKTLALAAVVLLLVAGGVGTWHALREATAPVAQPPGAAAQEDPSNAPRRHVARGAAADAEDVATAPPGTAAEGEERGAARAQRIVRGRVEDVDARPIAGATVAWREANAAPVSGTAAAAPADGDAPRAVPTAGPAPLRASPAAPPGATSAADGTFELHTPRGRVLDVSAVAAGYVVERATVAADAEELVVRLRRAVALRVRVLGPGGVPTADRIVEVREEVRDEGARDSRATDSEGVALFPRLAAGAFVTVRTRVEGRVSDVQERLRLPAEGEASIDLRDDGLRRVRVTAHVTGADVPVTNILVDIDGGGSELRAWPGGAEATLELPAGRIALALQTAAARGAAVAVEPDANEVALGVDVPPVRWVELELGGRDPRLMSFAGGHDAAELLYASDLTPFAHAGTLRLPLVEGAEYALRLPDGRERVLGAHVRDRVDLDEPAATVRVRLLPAQGTTWPEGVHVTASALVRALRNVQGLAVSLDATSRDALVLELLPGVTYALVVTAPGRAAARIVYRVGESGAELPVPLPAGGPLRVHLPGLDARSQVKIAAFPALESLASRMEEGTVVIDGVGDGWAMLLSGAGVYVVRGATAGAERTAPRRDTFALQAESAQDRTFLVGLDPLADGVHAVAAIGLPIPVPEGRYVPVTWRSDAIVVYEPVHLSAAAPSWTRPADIDVTWTEGSFDGAGAADLVIDTASGSLPLGRLVAGAVTRWKSAAPGVRVESVR